VPPERRGMSMIFQSYAIWPNMTVEQNVAFGLELRKLPREEVKRRVGEILEVVQLNKLAHRYPAELSGGQQQRVALARSIVVKPSVLLLDEPLANLDANLREEMRFEIRRLHDEFRITTVYVTHDQAEAMATSDRIAVMNAGRIDQVDAPHLLYTRPRTRFVAGFVGRTNLLEARVEGGDLLLDGVNLGPAARAGIAHGVTGAVLVSLWMLDFRPRRWQAAPAPDGCDDRLLWRTVALVALLYLGVGSFWFQHWYLVWVLAPAALLPDALLTRWLLPWLGFGALVANVISAFAPALAPEPLSKIALAALIVAVLWTPVLIAGGWHLGCLRVRRDQVASDQKEPMS